jgi:hypothetical protein
MCEMKERLNRFLTTVDPVRFFVITAACFGLLFIIATPPFQTPDEPAHFFRAYQVSQFNLILDKKGTTYGGTFPGQLEKTIDITMTNPTISFIPGAKYN